MRAAVALALFPILSLARPAAATDLELGLDVGGAYNSNLFGSPTNPMSDFSARLGPRIRLMDETGAFQWALRYWPTYEKYLRVGEADGWNQDLDARATWGLSRRTRLRFTEQFLDTGNVNEIFTEDQLPDGTIDTGLEFGRDRIRTNTVSLGLDHSLAPRHETDFTIQRSDSEFRREFRSKSSVTGVSGSYLYTWDRLDRLGFRLAGTEQEVTTGADSRATRYYNLSFQWLRSFDPTLTLNAAVGPTWVDQPQPALPSEVQQFRFFPFRASTCPRNDQGELFRDRTCELFGPEEIVVFRANPAPFTETIDAPLVGSTPSTGQNITYFADIELTKQWREFVLTLSYTRDASTTSELSGIVVDRLAGYLVWRPSPLWAISLRGHLQRREQPTSGLGVQFLVEPATVDGVPDVTETTGFRLVTRKRTLVVDDYLAGVYVNYRLNRWTRLYLNFNYEYETLTSQLENAAVQGGNWNRFYLAVGVTYTLPPFHLPF